MCVFLHLVWLAARHTFQLDWLTACMFHLDLDSPLLLFQMKSVETRLPCCVVHWSGAAGDIWPIANVDSKLHSRTGVTAILHWAIDVEDINRLVQERCNSIANAPELRISCTNSSIWIFKPFWPYFPACYAHTLTLMGSELIACGGKASREHSRCLSSVEAYNMDAGQGPISI